MKIIFLCSLKLGCPLVGIELFDFTPAALDLHLKLVVIHHNGVIIVLVKAVADLKLHILAHVFLAKDVGLWGSVINEIKFVTNRWLRNLV